MQTPQLRSLELQVTEKSAAAVRTAALNIPAIVSEVEMAEMEKASESEHSGRAGADGAAGPTVGQEQKQKKARKRRRGNAELVAKIKHFNRGAAANHKQVEDKKLKGKLKLTERLVGDATVEAARANAWLLPEESGYLEAEGLEKTWNFQQRDIREAVDAGAASKAINLRLPELGPYALNFTHSGRHLVLGGQKGHLAVLDWHKCQILCEEQVRETVHDVHFLHSEQFFAAAQKKYVYIYDKRGMEVHCLKDMGETWKLDFLRHHFLLTAIGQSGVLHYQDTTTGQMVCSHRTRLGPCNVMRHNPWNAVMGLGHANGTVTMWTPNITTPVVKLLTHRGPVRSLAVDPTGRYMATSGADSQVKVWDVRMLRQLHAYFSHAPAEYLDISQKGLLAIGYGRRAQVWKDALADKASGPYMNHSFNEGTLHSLRFCPYEDVLAAGHSGGVGTLLVPGAGEPNIDSFVANPYQTKKQRREAEVVQLLEKLQPSMIVLDPDAIGKVRRAPKDVQKERQAEAKRAAEELAVQQRQKNEVKTRMKGKNKPSRKFRKKQLNVIDEKRAAAEERKAEEAKRARLAKKEAAPGERSAEEVPSILKSFYKKKR